MKKILSALLAVLLLCTACTTAPATKPQTTTPPTTTAPETTAPGYEIISIAKALELCGEAGNITTERYYIRATIESVTNANFGAMVLTDGKDTIPVYGIEGYSSMADKPYKGDEVLLSCILQNYNGNKEIKTAQIIEFKHVEIEIDESAYTQMTIDEARKAAKDTKVKVSGTVARITYANGMIPSGVILVDGTNSIYVYDGDLAGRVKVGNTITILASKTYWILGDETANAEKFGYKGCNQLESATLLENDNGNTEFDKSWITESTVKQMLDTPVTEDITTTIFKVNALVNKAEGTGFTNYYFNDIDGTTGSYTYSQCNGSDFSWLDAFDGKICTVYLMVLNAKSTTSGCVYRFLPIAVADEGYTFNTDNAAEYAVKYHGVGQFLSSYTGDPQLQLQTTVSSTLLGFENATLSYTSADSSIIKIENGVMHCLKTGTTTVTVTGSYGGKEYSESVEISVTISQQPQSAPTVADAIAAAVGEKVTVKGIVGPSLVNRSGFYLIDETGVIAIITDEATLSTLSIGNEVVLSGKRHINTKGGSGYHGQTCIVDAVVESNAYGEHAYSDATFVSGKTVKEFYDLDPLTDYTTTVFVLKATVLVEESAYYTNIYLTDGSTKIRLYCSSAKQYGWLKEFSGQEITVEIAACNWNDKNYYTGCVLAVVTDTGKILNTLNFAK